MFRPAAEAAAAAIQPASALLMLAFNIKGKSR